MDKALLTGILAGAAIVTAGGAIAGYRMLDRDDYATVTHVEPVTETIRTPREVCGDELVREQAPVRDEKRVAGTVIGAVVGGVLGNQVGSGDGRKAATVAGAAAGGYAGSRIQKSMQRGNTTESVRQRCETVYDSRQETVAYNVSYTLDGDEGTVRMDHDPGERVPAREIRLARNE